jgi:hypothetical protein
MSINNTGKFTTPYYKATPVPSLNYDTEAKERHDAMLREELEKAPSINASVLSNKVGNIENGIFVEDEGRIILKEEYAEVILDCMNSRHHSIIAKVIGSIMEYLSGQIQDYTSSVFVDDKLMPQVLEFYETKHLEVMDAIENKDEEHKMETFKLRIPNNVFHKESLIKFGGMTQEFINGDINSDNYLSYLKAIKGRMKTVKKHNRLLKDGVVSDISDYIKV